MEALVDKLLTYGLGRGLEYSDAPAIRRIVKDASANKCGVITSSYEIISGIILDEKDFQSVKTKLVSEVMDILRRRADDEAEWLFAHFTPGGKPMTANKESRK